MSKYVGGGWGGGGGRGGGGGGGHLFTSIRSQPDKIRFDKLGTF